MAYPATHWFCPDIDTLFAHVVATWSTGVCGLFRWTLASCMISHGMLQYQNRVPQISLKNRNCKTFRPHSADEAAFFLTYLTLVVFAVIRVVTALFIKETLASAANDVAWQQSCWYPPILTDRHRQEQPIFVYFIIFYICKHLGSSWERFPGFWRWFVSKTSVLFNFQNVLEGCAICHRLKGTTLNHLRISIPGFPNMA